MQRPWGQVDRSTTSFRTKTRVVFACAAATLLLTLSACMDIGTTSVQNLPLEDATTSAASPTGPDCTSATEKPKPSKSGRASAVSRKPSSSANLLALQEAEPQAYGTRLHSAWGPPRPLFTMCRPSTTPTINSIDDRVNKLREPSFLFFDTWPITKTHQEWAKNDPVTYDHLTVKKNSVYIGEAYFWNDVADDVPNSDTQNASIHIRLPQSLTRQGFLTADVSASNTTPRNVFSTMVLDAPNETETYEVTLVPGSAKVYSTDVYTISEADLTSDKGARIGCKSADGVLTGAGDCWGYLLFKIKISSPRFLAKIESTDSLAETEDTQAGSKVDVAATITNTSGSAESNVTFEENLPPGLTFDASTASTDVVEASGAVEVTRGVSFNSGQPKGSFWVSSKDPIPPGGYINLTYSATVDSDQCRGAWFPITSKVWQGDVYATSQLMVNVVATC